MEPIKDGKKSDRGSSGRFVKGNRASPGRPPGRGTVSELRDKLAQDMDQIIDKVREQALSGDLQATRIVLDRILPALRPVEMPAAVAGIPAAGTMTAKAGALLDAAMAGVLAPGQAAQLIAALGTVSRIAEVDELTARIEALEKRHANNP
ncbi:MAG: hypothetical protein H6930_06100 [Rhodoferax sp.]|nr:hypothetical protein [Rhodoferax sp.]